MESYFCKPQAPWQKGTVENTNGRIRRYLPSDTKASRPPAALPAHIEADRNNGLSHHVGN